MFVSMRALAIGVCKADFLNQAVEAILALYTDASRGGAHPVESVMVVGHSLGGVVTR